MNKQEIIVKLTELFTKGNTQDDLLYNSAIIDAITTVRENLDETVGPPTAGDVVYELEKRDLVVEAIHKHFRTKINILDQRVVAHYINRNEHLKAVKAYKEATGGTMGLKECKHDVDKVRTVIGSMTKGEYEAIWEKMPY